MRKGIMNIPDERHIHILNTHTSHFQNTNKKRYLNSILSDDACVLQSIGWMGNDFEFDEDQIEADVMRQNYNNSLLF